MTKQTLPSGIGLIAGIALVILTTATAHARGVTPYLPLQLEPQMERQIERLLILADKPVLTRPIAAATVLDALPKACQVDAVLCGEVRRFLNRYMHSSGIAHASIAAAAASGADKTLPNRHGLSNDSAWEASAGIYWQFNDYALINLGGLAYEGETVPVGSIVSLGFSRAQLDIGYRDHWLSPMTDSSMLIGTEAPTMPSVTLSNYEPFTRLGLRYEIFLAQMSSSDRIAIENGFTSGRPRLAGLHLSMEPVSGWALGLNRLMQYGGGARGGGSLNDLFDAFLKPVQADNTGTPSEFGNQLASITSRFLFPTRTPFSVYFEYAGEDTSHGRAYQFGNSSLSAGIHFPRLWKRFDLTYEASEWQNSWYVHHIYQDGFINKGHVLGHWGGDNRQVNDGVGGQSHMLRLGWESRSGAAMELRYRTLANESYSTVSYERAHDLMLQYSRPWKQFRVGGEVFLGRDVYGDDFSRVGAFLRLSENMNGQYSSAVETDSFPDRNNGAELFIDAGLNANKVKIDLEDLLPGFSKNTTDTGFEPHLAIGARRAVSANSDFGARLELDKIDGHLLMGVRALDYRYRFRNPLALTAFAGAARYEVATPAYGIYGGVGAQWRDILRGWDLGFDLRYTSKVARDDLLPTDVTGGRPDSFYDIYSATLFLSRRL